MSFQVAAMNLALLHQAIREYAASPEFDGSSPPQPTANWLAMCEQKATEYASEPSRNGLEPATWASFRHSIVSLASQVSHILRRCDYIGLWNSAVSLQRLSWNDYGLHVLRAIGPKGQIATLQQVDPVVDHPMRDLGSLTAQALAQHGAAEAIQVIKHYESFHPLSTAERTSVAAFAAFPDLALWQAPELHPLQSESDGEPNAHTRLARCIEAAHSLLSATIPR